MMKKKQFIIWSVVLLCLVIFVFSHNVGKRSETIIIPSHEENHIEDQKTHPFQVKTIYRLPKVDQLLGWSSSNSIIGLFGEKETSERRNLQHLSYPYEKPEELQKIESNIETNLKLSPDGKSMVRVTMESNKTAVKLISLANKKETEIASFTSNQQTFVPDYSWSNNSRYVCFLVLSVKKDRQPIVNVYDRDAKTLKTYQLKGVDEKEPPSKVNISDNGRGLLLIFNSTHPSGQQYSMMMGTLSSKDINIQYKRQITDDEPVWLNNDQFVFLDNGETLYEYDRRNSELSVLLEKVSSFKFSNDRKKIAYSLFDKDSIYAGKLQGKNILYEEPVYHSTKTSEMFWSPDNNNLLITNQMVIPYQSFDTQAYIITFK
ncbi:WD40 repeat domain-containing protein [Bacillus sp. CLL-7-23]|uniref:WD40 repeat domain-containing protein n=1 Tax=Bacillus changyiensis TaxID=3004103 RepID=A0ABT4WZ65_9BACI|nr:WD40 repeat domain-containing protein [Bacillus changyiensis]MDA7025167.1 WD40 repeat domain-containing protein [Bacillus changyiensis]